MFYAGTYACRVTAFIAAGIEHSLKALRRLAGRKGLTLTSHKYFFTQLTL